jgi:hypothetical protein
MASPVCFGGVYELLYFEFFFESAFLKINSGIVPTLRPGDIELKGVRHGDTGLSAAGYSLRKKSGGKPSTRVGR